MMVLKWLPKVITMNLVLCIGWGRLFLPCNENDWWLWYPISTTLAVNGINVWDIQTWVLATNELSTHG
jgi:hypothetical protein